MTLNIDNAADAIEAHYQYIDWVTRNDQAIITHWAFLKVTEHAEPLHHQVLQDLQTNEIAFVSDEAIDLVNEAVTSLPDDEVLLPSDTEGRDLALWLQTPIPYYIVADAGGGYMVRENWEIQMLLISHVNIDEDSKPGICVVPYGRCLSTEEGEDRIVKEIKYPATGYASLANKYAMPADSIAISFRTPLTIHFSEAPWVSEMLRWVIALYRLMGDHIVRSAGQASRPQLKRIQRLGFPPNGYLTEFKLRKVTYEGNEDGTGVPLRFRHRVRGHWRKFYCPSLGLVGDREAYRYKYVDDYVRGPKGTPFIDSTRVIAVKR